jgi:hypothetical protein
MRHILAGQPPQVAPRQRKVSRNYTKTGRIITCEWHNSWLYDAADHFVSALSFGQHITARQQAEEDEAARVFADRVQDRGREVSRKAGPQQEHSLDPVQARVQSAWGGQVTAHDVHAAR